jgi:type IV pilus assembly protein PilW
MLKVSRRRQRGLSLVELMVGITVGLFVVAAAAMLTATQLSDNRRLLLEAQVQSDLRASADIITRELRRAGGSTLAHLGVWSTTNATPVENPRQAISPTEMVTSEILYEYRRPDTPALNFGFKRVTRTQGELTFGVLQALQGTGGWQDLTDPNTLDVTSFAVAVAQAGPELRVPCPKPCPLPLPTGVTDPQHCWPQYAVRNATITIEGRARSDPAVFRSISSTVRLRNDAIFFKPSSTGPVCPA